MLQSTFASQDNPAVFILVNGLPVLLRHMVDSQEQNHLAFMFRILVNTLKIHKLYLK
jgi:hypothetical protein